MIRYRRGSMTVSFVRTGERRYAVRATLGDGRILQMDPAPGFDPWMPHDLQHFIVEKHLGIDGAVFGRLAAGGTAGTFHPVADGASPRDAARLRRKHAAKDERLMPELSEDYARSERATYVCWQDWLQHADDPTLRARAAGMAPAARSMQERMTPALSGAAGGDPPRLRAAEQTMGGSGGRREPV
jgi:hypothetical protein